MLKPIFDSRGAAYDAKRDGSLSEYLKTHDGYMAFPLFYGLQQYHMLWDEGWIVREYSIIRIMWNVGRGDEHYLVIGRDNVKGIENDAHGGAKGFFDMGKLLNDRDGICWEAQHLSIIPTPGENIFKSF